MLKKILLILLTLLFYACSTNGGKMSLTEIKNSKAPTLIPRKILFGNPEKTRVSISPGGKRLGYIAPSEKGVLNVWIKTIGKDDDKMITNDTYRGIRSYNWAYNNSFILYSQDYKGDENFHLYGVNLETNEVKDLTPFEGVKISNTISDRNFPDEILIGLNKRDKQLFDMYRLNLKSGELKLEAENPGDVSGWGTDHNFIIKYAQAVNPEDGSSILRVRDSIESDWRDLMFFPFGENGGAVGFTTDNKNLLVETSVGFDTTRLIEVDFQTGKEIREIVKNDKADVGTIIDNPETHEIQAVSFNYMRREWVFFDKALEADFDILKKVKDGELFLVSRSLSDKKWIVAYMLDDAPYSYYFYDRETKQARFLFTHQPSLEKYELSKMKPVIIKARDGLNLVSYLTLPKGSGQKNLPMVLYVHGGPWARDGWGFDSSAQWLANRGYAVLQVNFRGSTGFGKNFINAGNKEWGTGKMQHDLTDAVKWAVDQKIADPKKVAIMGGSYGGYAALAGLTFTPDLYSCGVDIVGPSNLRTLMETIPPYWKPFKKEMLLRIGDVEANAEFNKKISPLYHVEEIKVPLLIGQGSNDPRVKISESDQIVEAMRKKGIPVEYIVFPDEGHGFARPENRMDFNGRVEQFLSRHLGGRAEKWIKEEGSTAESR